MEIIAVILTILAGFAGGSFWGKWVNYWEVGPIFSIAVMGFLFYGQFAIHEINK